MGSGYRRNVAPLARVKAPGSQWIDDHMADLPNNHWVAASNQGVVAQSTEVGNLMNMLKQKHVDPVNVTIAFVSRDAV